MNQLNSADLSLTNEIGQTNLFQNRKQNVLHFDADLMRLYAHTRILLNKMNAISYCSNLPINIRPKSIKPSVQNIFLNYLIYFHKKCIN